MTEEQARKLVDVVAALVTRVESIGFHFRSGHCIFCGAYRGYEWRTQEHHEDCAVGQIEILQDELSKEASE